MLNIWEDFAWSAGKRLQICTHHKCHIIFKGGTDCVGSPRCLFPPCKLHVFSILGLFTFLLWSCSTFYYRILTSVQFPVVITPILLNSPPPYTAPSPPFSPSIFILPSHTCPLTPQHSQCGVFYSPLQLGAQKSLSIHSISIHSSLPSLPPTPV